MPVDMKLVALGLAIALFLTLTLLLVLLYKSKLEYQHQLKEFNTETASLKERLNTLNNDYVELEYREQKSQREYNSRKASWEQIRLELSSKLSGAQAKLSEQSKEIHTLDERVASKEMRLEALQAELTVNFARIKELETLLENERTSSSQKLELLEQNKIQMKLEFQELAESILKSNSERFTHQNSESLTQMILPIKEQFDAFKKQIHDVYLDETKERSMLQAQINHIKEINQQMSKEARDLTNALKGESKTQGVWGEMILERVLENSGLKEGESFRREVSLEHEKESNRYRPDVIVYLPDRREIIIDAKTSLRAYEAYISTSEDTQKEQFADHHLASMRKHIKSLSDKEYTGLNGVTTLDFIFMFVPVESALMMAMERDSGLFDFAFKKNIILVGPSTLMVALRAVENSWKQEYQQRNAMEIAKRAGLIYDKFVGFMEGMERLGKQINGAQKIFDETHNRLHLGSGSLTNQFEKLKKLGAASSKSLPQHMLENPND